MTRTALVLGSNGRFGRNMSVALARHGWAVRSFDRASDTLPDAALGCDLIVNAWNPPYSRWADELPAQTKQVISAAKASGATVLMPGNVYVYGTDLPEVLAPDTPHRSTHPLGQLRRQMEESYRASGVRTILLRAGDYIDTDASGNWFDRVMIPKLGKGQFVYPGPVDQAHAWAYLPDLAEVGARLAEQREELPTFSEHLFEGYTLSGSQMADALAEASGRLVRIKRMNWLPIHLARPFWSEARHILEMRYLWQRPHRVDGRKLGEQVPGFDPTPLSTALRRAIAPVLQKETSTQTSRWSEAS